jgi:hypothetical protein
MVPADYVEQCQLCDESGCDCISSVLPGRIPHPTGVDGRGQGVRAIGFEGEIVYRKEQVLGELLGKLVPLDTHHDGWAMELEPIAQIYTKDMGNWVRKVNHSCRPSAEFRVMKISGSWRQMLVAITDIPHNGEITTGCGNDFLRGRGIKCQCVGTAVEHDRGTCGQHVFCDLASQCACPVLSESAVQVTPQLCIRHSVPCGLSVQEYLPCLQPQCYTIRGIHSQVAQRLGFAVKFRTHTLLLFLVAARVIEAILLVLRPRQTEGDPRVDPWAGRFHTLIYPRYFPFSLLRSLTQAKHVAPTSELPLWGKLLRVRTQHNRVHWMLHY